MSERAATVPLPEAQPLVGGWHLAEWASELVGTFLLHFTGFSVVVLLVSSASPLAGGPLGRGLKLVLIGIAFGVAAAAVALSPLGRRSGAHLNPAVTFGFWLRGHVHPHDLAGYLVAQVLGGLAAAGALRLVWGSWAERIADTATVPALAPLAALGIETALTAGLLLVIFGFLSSPRTVRWTPAAVVVALALLIRLGAASTGASMNPARTLGPALVADQFRSLWVYLVGPLAGAAVAVAVFALLAPGRRTLTAKLFHDQRYPTVVRTDLPAEPAGAHVDRTLPSSPFAVRPEIPVAADSRQDTKFSRGREGAAR
ncbi:MAG: MIP/aquaporin family protein [Gaiellaceae bacterium]